MTGFYFTEDDLKIALRANGWREGWGADSLSEGDWVPPGGNPDWNSISFKQAVESLLYNKNLTPKNMERFWK